MQRTACLLLLLLLFGCAREVRPIIADPLDPHDRERDIAYCQKLSGQYGVINLEPTMSGSDQVIFPDEQRRVVLYEACMEKKGYRFGRN